LFLWYKCLMRPCSRCGVPHEGSHRYCLTCHAAYMREWRTTHRLTEDQRLKDIARSYANVYKRRGLLFQEDCQRCGSPDSQMHHADYTKPLEVEWVCRQCHLIHHAKAS
jgi:hypothetical protein